VFARAAVAVAAGADLVVEGAVDLILLRAEDGGEVVGHGDGFFFAAVGWLGGQREWADGGRRGRSCCARGRKSRGRGLARCHLLTTSTANARELLSSVHCSTRDQHNAFHSQIYSWNRWRRSTSRCGIQGLMVIPCSARALHPPASPRSPAHHRSPLILHAPHGSPTPDLRAPLWSSTLAPSGCCQERRWCPSSQPASVPPSPRTTPHWPLAPHAEHPDCLSPHLFPVRRNGPLSQWLRRCPMLYHLGYSAGAARDAS